MGSLSENLTVSACIHLRRMLASKPIITWPSQTITVYRSTVRTLRHSQAGILYRVTAPTLLLSIRG